MFVRLVLALFLCAFVCAPAFPLCPAGRAAAAESSRLEREAGQAWSASARSLGLQTELPVKARAEAAGREKDQGLSAEGSAPFLSQDLATYILYGSIFVILILVSLNLRGSLWSSSRSRRLIRGEDGSNRAAAARMDKAQLAAEEIARAGNFTEAMHALLLQSLAELRRLDLSFASSLTSREILRSAALPSEGRELFADIVSRVEISYFGAHQPDREEYLACRSSFESLTEVIRRGAGRA
jgi:hypothetical protein